MSGKVLAVDPGEKRIGIAVSDPTSTIAKSLDTIIHKSMTEDCQKILRLALENECDLIVIGEPKNEEGMITPQMRHARKIAETIQQNSELPVELWDENFSTQTARQARITMNVKRKDRSGHLDSLAAVVILQSYLDWKNDERKLNA